MSTDPYLTESVPAGHYAKKQILCKDRVIAWSHGSRFHKAVSLIEPYAGKRFLDYGCGDGTFLGMVADRFPNAVGSDIDARQNADCATRLGGRNGVSIIHISELEDPRYEAAFDIVTCMETLEHCLPKHIEWIVPTIRRVLVPGGTLIISVPIEIGPTLFFKEAYRSFAGWRKVGDYQYKERYTPGELLKMTFAGARTSVVRPTLGDRESYGHKGFNWKALRERLSGDFVVEQTSFTPLGWTRGLLSSQAWLVCKNLTGDQLGRRGEREQNKMHC